MTARSVGSAARPTATAPDPLLTEPDPLASARSHVAEGALRETPPGPGLVGLELEFHLVDRHVPATRPGWERITTLVAAVPPLPAGSSVTVEPGGQLELSTPPAADIASAVAALAADRRALTDALGQAGYGAAPLGADPARRPERVNPSRRYVAMERHFRALGCADPGRAMMTSTAALQVNLDAGPASGWADRVAHLRGLGPVLVALSACSPYLGGATSGWHSMRQQTWHGIDHRRSGPVDGSDPAQAWADYALDAPVMLVRGADGDAQPVTSRVRFADWVSGRSRIGRRPTTADLDYHLTTLFPPIRPRGYLELRFLDAVPDRWWPALAAVTAVLADDPVAADRAAELCEPVRDHWVEAARDGLADPQVSRAARGCLAVALERCPDGLAGGVGAYAELVDRGRTPGDEVRDRITATDPLTALLEEADA